MSQHLSFGMVISAKNNNSEKKPTVPKNEPFRLDIFDVTQRLRSAVRRLPTIILKNTTVNSLAINKHVDE